MSSTLVAMVSIYDSGEWIENRLHNLSLSTYKDIEIWCVNANSPDPRDHEIPLKFANIDKRYKYIKLDNRISLYETWNYIIQKSDSKYVACANTDDVVAHQLYSQQIAVLDHNPQIGFVYPSWYKTEVPNQKWSDNVIGYLERPGSYHDPHRSSCGHFPMWRRDLHDKYGLFDTRFKAVSDADFWARCFINGVGFYWIGAPLGIYLWRSGQNLWNRSITDAEWEMYRAKVTSYAKNRS